MEYLTIPKFAELAGVTPQAIYRRLSTDLQSYLKLENGVKVLSEEALSLFALKQQNKDAQRIQELESLVSQLQDEKYALIMEKAEISIKLLEITEKHNQQIENFQLLLAQNQQLQQTLIQLPSSVERIDNSLKQLESSVGKRSWWPFSKKNKA